jgi:hypothetical protein
LLLLLLLLIATVTGVSDGEAPGSVWAVVFLSFMFDMLLAANLVLQWVAYNDFIKVLLDYIKLFSMSTFK